LAAILLLLLVALGIALLDRTEWGQTRKCLDGLEEAYSSIPSSQREALSYETFRQSGERLCEELGERGLYDDDPSDPAVREEVNAILAENPEILVPSCVSAQIHDFKENWPSTPSSQVMVAAREVSERYCELALEEGLISLGRYPSEEEAAQLFSAHPEISAPLCAEIAMEDYEPGLLVVRRQPVSRASFKRFATRLCAEAARAGLFSFGPSEDLSRQEDRQLTRIFRRVRAEMVASGELP
jgi:hypothetical protein